MTETKVTNDELTMRCFLTAIMFFIIGTFLGFLGRWAVSNPGMMENITFYRIVTHHPYILVTGWTTMLFMALTNYLTPLVTRRPMFSETAAEVAYWLTTIGTFLLVLGVIPGFNGSYARYSALPPLYHPFFPTMLGLCICLVAVFVYGTNVLKTFMSIPEGEHKHTATWYFTMGAILGILFLTMAGVPFLLQSLVGLLSAEGDIAYSLDPLISKHLIWWGLHSYVNQMINVTNLGMMYVIIPLLVGKAIYSEKGATWGLFLYLIVNNLAYFHHLLMDPILSWQKVLGQLFTWGLGLTTALSIYNLMKTAIGGEKWGLAMKFIIAGLIGFIVEGSIGIFHSTLVVQLFAHNTQAILGYVHAVLFSYITMCGIGALYALIPRIKGVPIYSKALGEIHFWGSNFMVAGMVIVLMVAGYSGMPRNVQEYDPVFSPHMQLATAFSFGLFVSQLIGAYNLFMTALAPATAAEKAKVAAA